MPLLRNRLIVPHCIEKRAIRSAKAIQPTKSYKTRASASKCEIFGERDGSGKKDNSELVQEKAIDDTLLLEDSERKSQKSTELKVPSKPLRSKASSSRNLVGKTNNNSSNVTSEAPSNKKNNESIGAQIVKSSTPVKDSMGRSLRSGRATVVSPLKPLNTEKSVTRKGTEKNSDKERKEDKPLKRRVDGSHEIDSSDNSPALRVTRAAAHQENRDMSCRPSERKGRRNKNENKENAAATGRKRAVRKRSSRHSAVKRISRSKKAAVATPLKTVETMTCISESSPRENSDLNENKKDDVLRMKKTLPLDSSTPSVPSVPAKKFLGKSASLVSFDLKRINELSFAGRSSFVPTPVEKRVIARTRKTKKRVGTKALKATCSNKPKNPVKKSAKGCRLPRRRWPDRHKPVQLFEWSINKAHDTPALSKSRKFFKHHRPASTFKVYYRGGIMKVAPSLQQPSSKGLIDFDFKDDDISHIAEEGGKCDNFGLESFDDIERSGASKIPSQTQQGFNLRKRVFPTSAEKLPKRRRASSWRYDDDDKAPKIFEEAQLVTSFSRRKTPTGTPLRIATQPRNRRSLCDTQPNERNAGSRTSKSLILQNAENVQPKRSQPLDASVLTGNITTPLTSVAPRNGATVLRPTGASTLVTEPNETPVTRGRSNRRSSFDAHQKLGVIQTTNGESVAQKSGAIVQSRTRGQVSVAEQSEAIFRAKSLKVVIQPIESENPIMRKTKRITRAGDLEHAEMESGSPLRVNASLPAPDPSETRCIKARNSTPADQQVETITKPAVAMPTDSKGVSRSVVDSGQEACLVAKYECPSREPSPVCVDLTREFSPEIDCSLDSPLALSPGPSPTPLHQEIGMEQSSKKAAFSTPPTAPIKKPCEPYKDAFGFDRLRLVGQKKVKNPFVEVGSPPKKPKELTPKILRSQNQPPLSQHVFAKVLDKQVTSTPTKAAPLAGTSTAKTRAFGRLDPPLTSTPWDSGTTRVESFYRTTISNTSTNSDGFSGLRKLIDRSGTRQLQIDAGQSRYGASECKTCGMVYSQGEAEDERQHVKFHKKMNSVLQFKNWKYKRVVDILQNVGVAIIVDSSDSKEIRDKVADVVVFANRTIGLDEESVRVDFEKFPNRKFAIFVHDSGRIVSVLGAEPCSLAQKTLPGDRLLVDDQNVFPVKQSIFFIWTLLEFRQQGLASLLLFRMRSFLAGPGNEPLTFDEIAFADLTPDLHKFVTASAERESFLVTMQ